MVLVVAGEKAAVTPAGRLEAARVTGALKFRELRTLIGALALPPSMTFRVLTEEDSVKLGVGTVTVMLVEAVRVPEVPVIVIVCGPDVAVAAAVNETVLAEVLLVGLKLAVMPEGRPATVNATAPVKPFAGITLILELDAMPPIGVDKVAEADDNVKLGANTVCTVMVIVVETIRVPEVPIIVMGCGPSAAVVPAIIETVLAEVLLVGLKLAVMPVGSPVAANVTVPIKPFVGTTLILEVTALPASGIDRVVVAGDNVKLGAVTAKLTVVELVTPPTVPDILTA